MVLKKLRGRGRPPKNHRSSSLKSGVNSMLTKKNSRKETKGVFRIEKHIIPSDLSWGCKKKSSANRKRKTSSSTGFNMSQIVIPGPIPDFDALKDENMLENYFSDIPETGDFFKFICD